MSRHSDYVERRDLCDRLNLCIDCKKGRGASQTKRCELCNLRNRARARLSEKKLNMRDLIKRVAADPERAAREIEGLKMQLAELSGYIAEGLSL